MNRTAIDLFAIGTLAVLLTCQPALTDDDASGPSRSPVVEAKSSSGPLRRPPSSTYFALPSEVLVRASPATSSAIVTRIISPAEPLRALGMVVEGEDTPSTSVEDKVDRARTWIKIQTRTGQTGFIGIGDLITPEQRAAKLRSAAKITVFEADVKRAKMMKGRDVPSGIYTHGGTCDATDASDADAGAFLATKVLIWQDGSKMHFVRVVQPDEPIVYDIQNDIQIRELQGFGYIPMRTFRSTSDTVLMGYKDKLLWFTTDGNRYDSDLNCDADAYDRVMSMLRVYAEQRPPEIMRPPKVASPHDGEGSLVR